MAAPVIVDASFGHASITPAALDKVGAAGAVLYAGCDNTGKNCTTAEVQALLSSGKTVGLVIENSATDLVTGGQKAGAYQGQNIVAAAKALGYDWQRCVLFSGYDTDAHQPDYATILDAMEAFAHYVPVPGYYGDSDSIDYLYARHPDWIYWQSASKSYSPENPSGNAHLWQRVGGTHGLPIDINHVLKTPLSMMGEDTVSQADVIAALQSTEGQAAIQHVVRAEVDRAIGCTTKDQKGEPRQIDTLIRQALNDALARTTKGPDGKLRQIDTLVRDRVQPLAAQLATVAADVAAQQQIDPDTLAAALAKAIEQLAQK